jgi:exodeoxyribonuclease-1
MNSIFWHDYETFGSDPRRDRPCQFAGIRTDLDLHVIDEPVEFFCKPAPDFLPDPGSVAVTGISPQEALRKGLPEAEFCARILQQFLEPGTCVAGYNSIRFDDELTRHLLYRCFYDPYEREWKNGNSRWDIIDLLRMTHALRPEGINWPRRDDGTPSFRLEELTRANGIAHADAHDALADVRATIAMAKLVKTVQPKLYDFVFALRSKHKVLPLLDLARQEPVVHVSGMFPATRACLGIVMPLVKHPQNSNGIVVADLLSDPRPWLNLDAATIRRKLYTKTAELPEGEQRIALKTVHLNRCPGLAPVSVLTAELKARYALDMDAVYRHRQQILAVPDLGRRLAAVFTDSAAVTAADPDQMLYSGGFFDDHDKRVMERMQRLQPEQLGALASAFHDKRLPELLFRYRARNYPGTLDGAELQRWQHHCRRRLLGEIPGAGVTRSEFEAQLLASAADLSATLAADLRAYADNLYRHCQLDQ